MVKSEGEGVHELTAEEAWAFFDSQAQRLLHMSGEEFIAAWKAGEFSDPDTSSEVMHMVMLLPFAASRG